MYLGGEFTTDSREAFTLMRWVSYGQARRGPVDD